MSERIERTPEVQALLVRAADNELGEQERGELERLAERDPSLREELAELRGASRTLAGLKLRNPNPDDWDRFEKGLVPKGERLVGWLALLGGTLVLVGFGLWAFFADPLAPLTVKIGAGLALAGLTLLFVQVARRFAVERSKDPYKDLVR
jgi:ferric-dicitrate binding protein FerR (iron transport regulator)